MDLPKQWKHWLRVNGFKWSKRLRGRSYSYWYPTRNGRRYRVTCLLDPVKRTPLDHRCKTGGIRMFQICDGDMDRWANSVGAEILLPTSHAEFKAAIATLLELSAPSISSFKCYSARRVERAPGTL